jgi:hypothetical protein
MFKEVPDEAALLVFKVKTFSEMLMALAATSVPLPAS